jgi:translation initiation factor 2B subunit (eIF-2B alpha/beta/delta family)
LIDPILKSRLQVFAQDHYSGSSELARKALEILAEFLDRKSGEVKMEDFSEIALTMIQSQPSMAPVINIVNRVCLAREKRNKPYSNFNLKETINKIWSEFNSEQELSIVQAISRLKKYTIIATYSRSSLVERTLLKLVEQNPDLKVMVSEGRPGYEGVALAQNLGSAGIKVKLCVDSALPGLLSNCEALLIGADAIVEDEFCNKIGTEILCRTAIKLQLPVFVISSNDKFLPLELRKFFRIIDHSSSEILSQKMSNVEVYNRLFEWIPNELVTEFICGEGVKTPDEIKKLIGAIH